MSIIDMADEYLNTIKILEQNIENCKQALEKTDGLELRRKLHDKLIHLETVLAQNVEVYHYITNYYNKDSKIKSWI